MSLPPTTPRSRHRPRYARSPVGPMLLALPLALTSCIEDRLSVEMFTQVNGDGTCTRRIEYRLERVDTDKGDRRVAIPPDHDLLLVQHRFPSGEPWRMRDEAETGLHLIVLEAVLPSPAAADGDYFRARAPRAQPARNFISAFSDPENGVYEYEKVFRDPSSPLAAARALSRAALKRDEAFARGFSAALENERAAPRESDLRRAYREVFAEPFAREVSALAERPLYGPRERRELEELYARLEEKQQSLAARLSALTPGVPPEAVDSATDKSVSSLGDELLGQLEAAGFPLTVPEGAEPARYRATLVMPAPILRANTCVAGDTAVWEFADEDLFGRGFEMTAVASAR
jgi:hypothetical protein